MNYYCPKCSHNWNAKTPYCPNPNCGFDKPIEVRNRRKEMLNASEEESNGKSSSEKDGSTSSSEIIDYWERLKQQA